MGIPDRLLVHSCILKKRTGIDRERNPVYESHTLRKVRIEGTQGVARASVGTIATDSLTLFIDRHASEYDVLPSNGDTVEFLDREYTVQSLKSCFTAGSADTHHWEVTLE